MLNIIHILHTDTVVSQCITVLQSVLQFLSFIFHKSLREILEHTMHLRFRKPTKPKQDIASKTKQLFCQPIINISMILYFIND